MGDGVARQVDGSRQRRIGGFKKLNVVSRRQHKADAGLHPVSCASANYFGNIVDGRPDQVSVIAQPTNQRVFQGVNAAVQNIGTGIAGDGLGDGVARQVDGSRQRRVGSFKKLDVIACRQNKADAGLHPVCRSAARKFSDVVGGGVDDIGVVAKAAHQRIYNRVNAAVQRVRAAAAKKCVCGAVAGDIFRRHIGDGDVHHFVERVPL